MVTVQNNRRYSTLVVQMDFYLKDRKWKRYHGKEKRLKMAKLCHFATRLFSEQGCIARTA